MDLIPKEIEEHYQQTKEKERLSSELGELERVRTQAILARHLPPPRAVVVDVGGAAGAYAFPLAEQGHEVHLIDPVDLHLEQARALSAASGLRLASITKGSARDLNFPTDSVDAVLLLGPLYHLIERSDRLQALREARRILKPQGVLFAAAISRFASLIAGLAYASFQDEEFRKIIAADLMSGVHRNPTDQAEYFTTAYFHLTEELAAEVKEAGFAEVQVLAIEGPVWSAVHFHEVWSDPTQRSKLLEFLLLIEQEPSVQGASAHLIAVASKP